MTKGQEVANKLLNQWWDQDAKYDFITAIDNIYYNHYFHGTYTEEEWNELFLQIANAIITEYGE